MQLRHKPAVLVLSRQPLPTLDRSKYAPASGVARGAYVLADAPGGNPEVILIASGSEVSLAVDAHETLLAEGIRSRVVSMPSWDIFEHQTQEYRDSVLPPAVKARVAIEQASTFGWERYVGASGQSDRHEDFRSLGAAQGAAEEIRLRAGARSRGSQGSARRALTEVACRRRRSVGGEPQGRSVLRSVTGDLGFPRAEMSESIRDNPNRRLSHAGVAIGDFALDP